MLKMDHRHGILSWSVGEAAERGLKNPACLWGGPGFFEIEITSTIAPERVLGSVRSGSMMRRGMTQQRR